LTQCVAEVWQVQSCSAQCVFAGCHSLWGAAGHIVLLECACVCVKLPKHRLMMQGTFVCDEGTKSWNDHKPALWRYECAFTTKPCWQLTALLCSQLEIVWLASNQGANLFSNALHEMPITYPVIREEGEGIFLKECRVRFQVRDRDNSRDGDPRAHERASAHLIGFLSSKKLFCPEGESGRRVCESAWLRK